jgi:acyl-CoA synthetase (NDP forming)
LRLASGIQDETAVRQVFTEIQNRLAQDGKAEAMDGVLVQPMTSGVELVIGVTQDLSSARSSALGWAAFTWRFSKTFASALPPSQIAAPGK